MSTSPRRWRLSRRQFLIGLGVTGGALAVGVAAGLPVARLKLAEVLDSANMPNMIDAQPSAWFEIFPDNKLRLHLPKVEMGQGVHTALAQIAAEELEVAWEQLEVVNASTAHGPVDPGGTSGSSTISGLWGPLREAAAVMREMLRTEAGRQLGVPAASIAAEAGVMIAPGARLTYGEIVARHTDEWEAPETPPALKPIREFKFVGQSVPRVDLPAKITGQAIYGYDLRAPNMLYGVVARPPRLGSELRRAGPGRAAGQPGVQAVVAERGFAGVAAETRAQAQAAVVDLELEWSDGEKDFQQADLEALTSVQPGQGVVIQDDGDAAASLKRGTLLTAEYRTPLAAHAHLEPQAALADVQPDRVRIWVSTQAAASIRGAVAKALGRKEAEVDVTATYLGGGFGRRVQADAAVEAARLSAAAGRPVHVGWSRAEEFRYGYFRPPTHHVLSGSLDEAGRILALQHEQASGDVLFAFLPEAAAAVVGADFGAWRGGRLQYGGIPNRRATARRVKLPVPTGSWRGLGLLANVFAIESFMDELAHAAGQDPLAFRLQHLGEDELGRRFRRALERTAERAGWGGALPAGRARGLACSVDVNTVVAAVAEVSVEAGRVRVHRYTTAVDCGLTINPDIALAQTEGSVMMGVSSTLLEEITLKDGRVEAGNFDAYPLLTIQDAPLVEAFMIGDGQQPYGMGEPPLGPVAAAVANAVFALTGQRLRRLPLRLA